MNNCICHTEAVAFGYTDCDYCEAALAADIVTYDDLITTHHQALLDEYDVRLGIADLVADSMGWRDSYQALLGSSTSY